MSRVGWSWSSGRHLRRLPAGQTVSWLRRDVPDGCPLAAQEECGRQVPGHCGCSSPGSLVSVVGRGMVRLAVEPLYLI
jgi:hypothetical protein